MKFLKTLILIILVILVVGAIYFASLDGSYDVKRSRYVDAAPEVVFNDLDEYRNWAEWGPWYEEDSTIQVNYADRTSGPGASYSWTSMDGEGEMRTVSTDPHNRIDAVITFKTPFGDMGSDVYWTLKPEKDGTELTWGMKGEMPFMMRFMAAGMDEQMGEMQERGLELFDRNLQQKLKIHNIRSEGVVDLSGTFYLYVTRSSRISDMNPLFETMMNTIAGYAQRQSIRLTGPAFSIYHKFDPEHDTTMFSVCYPIRERVITEKGSEVLNGYMERGSYLKTVLEGSYENSKKAWEQAMADVARLEAYQMDPQGEPFEIYVKHHTDTRNPAELLTEIFIPVLPRLP